MTREVDAQCQNKREQERIQEPSNFSRRTCRGDRQRDRCPIQWKLDAVGEVRESTSGARESNRPVPRDKEERGSQHIPRDLTKKLGSRQC